MSASARHRRQVLKGLALSGMVGTTGLVMAQAPEWPAKPIRLVVGYPPGGSGDFITRVAADELSKELGVSVVVDNRPGE
jgi:tripartite-type tricarboxylate transporter receptor subunit TctC